MAQQIIKFDYNGSQIPFEKGSDVMVNLTAMAKAYPDKNLSTIVNSQEISDYCTSLSKLQNFSFADLQQITFQIKPKTNIHHGKKYNTC